MAVTRRVVLLVLLTFCISPGQGQRANDAAAGGQTQTTPNPPVATKVTGGVSGVVAPGATLLIPVSGYTSHAVTLHAVSAVGKNVDVLEGTPVDGGLSIKLPANLDVGSYFFTLGDKDMVVPGSVMVAPASIKLISVYPSVAYQSDTNAFNFNIVGENFSENSLNDDVTIDGRGSIVKVHGASEADCQGKESCLWVENSRTMHLVGYRSESHQGIIKVGVRVGNVAGVDEKPLVLARHSGAFVFLASAAFTLGLFGLVYYIVAKGLSKNNSGRKRLPLLETFIFDPQTNSYSLSKFQLMMFSATFVFGYVYILLSRLLVQWQFSLPDVPMTIVGLLSVSGGTAIAATGLTSALGSKGAGLQHPTGADLISTGGVVVPERFQFFVWTIIACGGFTALLIGQDPAKLSNFPDLPTGLLYVMGVSAGGYLGGKATRKPGPIVEYVIIRQPKGNNPWPTLLVQGQNLASDGRILVDEIELGYPSDADEAMCKQLPAKLVTPTPQTGAADPTFSKQLSIIVVNSAVAASLARGNHSFRIVNQDGQFAKVTFSAIQPTIASIYEQGTKAANGSNTLRATDQAITAIIAGSGLDSDSQVTWRAPGQTEFAALSMVPGGPEDGTQLWVSMVPGGKTGPSGTVKVTTAAGVVVNGVVDVVQTSGGSTPPPVAPNNASGPAASTSAVVPSVASAAIAPTPETPISSSAPAKGPGAADD